MINKLHHVFKPYSQTFYSDIIRYQMNFWTYCASPRCIFQLYDNLNSSKFSHQLKLPIFKWPFWRCNLSSLTSNYSWRQLNDERQVAWNVGQWVCNEAHIMSAHKSPHQSRGCHVCFPRSKLRAKLDFFSLRSNVIKIKKICKLCYKTGAQPQTILPYIFKINRCQTWNVLLSVHDYDLTLDQFNINK